MLGGMENAGADTTEESGDQSGHQSGAGSGEQSVAGAKGRRRSSRGAVVGAWLSGVAFVLLGVSLGVHLSGGRDRGPAQTRITVNGEEFDSIGDAAKQVGRDLIDGLRGADSGADSDSGGATDVVVERVREPVETKRAITRAWTFWSGIGLVAVGMTLGAIAWWKRDRRAPTYIALWPVGVVLLLVMMLGSLPSA